MFKDLDLAVAEKLNNYKFYDYCKIDLAKAFPKYKLFELAKSESAATMVSAYEEYLAAWKEIKTNGINATISGIPARTRLAVSARYWYKASRELLRPNTSRGKFSQAYQQHKGMVRGVMMSALVVGGMELLNRVLAELEEASAYDAEFSAVALAQDMKIRREIMNNLPADPVLGLLLPEAEQRAILEQKDTAAAREFRNFLFNYVGFALATQQEGTFEREIYLKIQAQEAAERVYQEELSQI